MATLAGIGFTVSLLIGELAFEGDGEMTGQVKAAVLMGSLMAALLATVLLKVRNAKYRRMTEAEERDEDLSGIPDIYEEDDPGVPPAHGRHPREEGRRAPPARPGEDPGAPRACRSDPAGRGDEGDRPA
ncbi:Na+/H+ antiporter NhaA [Streptomyces thinghirensis]|nr:Na+/H+ antiporter NhaA [Streptomyces thinghirensis]